MQAAPPPTGHKQRFVFERPFQRKTRPSIVGWLLMIFYLCALIFYIYVRAAKTLNLGAKYQWCEAIHQTCVCLRVQCGMFGLSG